MPARHLVLMHENTASIRDVQKSPSKALRGITRVMRGTKTIGFFFANDEAQSLFEDIEAARSTKLKTRLAHAKANPKDGVSLKKVMAEYGL